MEPNQLKRIVEGALLASGQALDVKRLLELFADDIDESTQQKVTAEDIDAALASIVRDCEGRGFELKQVSSGWRFQVREETAPWVNRLWEEKPQKYSRAMLETLALIAYRQPITRGDIEEIRGVAVSSHIIKTLSERDWVKVVGHRDVPGRPSLYATTKTFLDYFNLKSLEELPSLGELADIEQLNPELNLEVKQGEEKPGEQTGEVESVAEPNNEGEQESTGSEEPPLDEKAAQLFESPDENPETAASSGASEVTEEIHVLTDSVNTDSYENIDSDTTDTKESNSNADVEKPEFESDANLAELESDGLDSNETSPEETDLIETDLIEPDLDVTESESEVQGSEAQDTEITSVDTAEIDVDGSDTADIEESEIEITGEFDEITEEESSAPETLSESINEESEEDKQPEVRTAKSLFDINE